MYKRPQTKKSIVICSRRFEVTGIVGTVGIGRPGISMSLCSMFATWCRARTMVPSRNVRRRFVGGVASFSTSR